MATIPTWTKMKQPITEILAYYEKTFGVAYIEKMLVSKWSLDGLEKGSFKYNYYSVLHQVYAEKKGEQFHNEKLGLTCRHCGVSVSPMKDNNTECSLCESDSHAEHQEWLLDMEEGESK